MLPIFTPRKAARPSPLARDQLQHSGGAGRLRASNE